MAYTTYVLGRGAQDAMSTEDVRLAQTPLPRKHEPVIHSEYLGVALEPAKVRRFLRAAKKLLATYQFESIAFRGMSGALIAPALALATNKTLLMVRKPQSRAKRHSSSQVEGDLAVKRYLIVDDFWSAGETIRTILRDVAAFAPDAKCIGGMFYNKFMTRGGMLYITQRWPMYDTDGVYMENPPQAGVMLQSADYVFKNPNPIIVNLTPPTKPATLEAFLAQQ